MSDRGALVPFCGCIAALAIAGAVLGAPWGYVLYAFAGLLLIALISEELFLILGLGASTTAVSGLLGQEAMTYLLMVGELALVAIVIVQVLGEAVDDAVRGRAEKGRQRRDVGGIEGRQRRRWERSTPIGEILRSPSQYLVSIAVRRMSSEIPRSERSRWEEEMRADVDSIRWAPARLLYAVGICRRGAPALPHGESARRDGAPQRYS